ncbi:MAG TPA: spore coat U domain-containing protein [Burkholderiaceae bacterium]|nr:spore coat U domain-containing protein [Burkholderiaceae bacterium]
MSLNHLLQRGTPILAAVALAAMPLRAAATDLSSTFNVTATVLATCTLSAGNVAFGNYAAGQLDATGTLSVTCTTGASYVIGLDAGTGSGATVATRRMTNGANSAQTLAYSLYRDASRALVWGTTLGVNVYAGVGTGSAQSVTVYGRVAGAQYPESGAYTDTVTATITY